MVGTNSIGRDRAPEITYRNDSRGVPQIQSNQIGVKCNEITVDSTEQHVDVHVRRVLMGIKRADADHEHIALGLVDGVIETHHFSNLLHACASTVVALQVDCSQLRP